MAWGSLNVAKHKTTAWTALRGVLPTRSLRTYVAAPQEGRGVAMPQGARETLARSLEGDVRELAGPLAGRGVFNVSRLRAAEEFVRARVAAAGLQAERQAYDCRGVEVANHHAEIPGTTDEVVVVGAHYDAVELREGKGLCPAANDNASGIATTMAIMHALALRVRDGWKPARRVRFSFWVNEEPPFFWTPLMGSLVDASRRRAAGERIVAMITPETIGCYSREPGTQRYPLPGMARRFGDAGDFVTFVGMSESRGLVRRCAEAFRSCADVRSAAAALPAFVLGVGASDHWSFWKHGYPGLMVTDTAPFRYRYYHTPDDTPEKLDYATMARVTYGLARVVEGLAS